MFHTFKCLPCEKRKVPSSWEYNGKHSFCPACGAKGSILYDFACWECAQGNVETYWQDTDLETKCPRCGVRGERRIYAPMVSDPEKRPGYKFADDSLKRGLDAQNITSFKQREEQPHDEERLPPGMDRMTAMRAGLLSKPFWGSAKDYLGAGQVAHASTLAEGNVTATEMGRAGQLPKKLFTEVTVDKGSPAPSDTKVS